MAHTAQHAGFRRHRQPLTLTFVPLRDPAFYGVTMSPHPGGTCDPVLSGYAGTGLPGARLRCSAGTGVRVLPHAAAVPVQVGTARMKYPAYYSNLLPALTRTSCCARLSSPRNPGTTALLTKAPAFAALRLHAPPRTDTGKPPAQPSSITVLFAQCLCSCMFSVIAAVEATWPGHMMRFLAEQVDTACTVSRADLRTGGRSALPQ